MKSQNFKELCSQYSHIQVCSYDAGGGNVLANLIDGLGINTSFIIGGPSVDIFSALFPRFSAVNSKTLDPSTDLLISSTGWQSLHEFEIMQEALSKGIPVVAVLDHWVNYVERFEKLGKTINPTFFLALDDYAEEKIIREFPNPNILRADNIYIKRALSEIENLRNSQTLSAYDFMFICEPLSHSSESLKWGEFDAIQDFFKALRNHGLTDLRIAIRPHPTEDSRKYTQFIPNDFKNVSIVDKTKLSVLLAETDSVVGCHSMALYIAELSGNRVYTTLPQGILSKVPLTKAQPIMNLYSAFN